MESVLKQLFAAVLLIIGVMLLFRLLPWLIIGMLLIGAYVKIRQYVAVRSIKKKHKEKSGRIIDVEYTEIK